MVGVDFRTLYLLYHYLIFISKIWERQTNKQTDRQYRLQSCSATNKNARRPKEAHNAQNLNEIKILDRAVEDLKELDQYQRFSDELKEMKKKSKELELTGQNKNKLV